MDVPSHENLSVTASEEFQAALGQLDEAFRRPLEALRAGFDRVAPPGNAGQTMISLCDSLIALARDYREFSRIVASASPSQTGPTAISALLSAVDREFRPKAEARGLAWSCALDGPDRPVSVDLKSGVEAIGQVAANAIRYTPEGGSVAISGTVDGASARIEVRDTGPGIPIELRERVFELFYRLPREHASNSVGSGLGLSLCRELLRRCDGSVAIESSEPSEGTRVVLSLPLAPAL